MLDWSMLDLASAAGLSISTVRRLETGLAHIVTDETCGLVRRAFEAAGLRFIGDGRTTIGVTAVLRPSEDGTAASTIAVVFDPREVRG